MREFFAVVVRVLNFDLGMRLWAGQGRGEGGDISAQVLLRMYSSRHHVRKDALLQRAD